MTNSNCFDPRCPAYPSGCGGSPGRCRSTFENRAASAPISYPPQKSTLALKLLPSRERNTDPLTYLCSMKILVQSFWLLFFYLLGLGVSILVGGVIPGSVLGMLLLFIALALGWVEPGRVDRLSELLLDNMVLFFLPAAVGLIASVGLILNNLTAILVAAAVSTVLIVAAVGITQQRLEVRKRKRKIRRSGHDIR